MSEEIFKSEGSDKGKQTEFDSSFATLQRIDCIIKGAHTSAVNMDQVHYIIFVERMFVEARAKMKQSELEKCEMFQDKINKLRTRYKNVLTNPFLIDEVGTRKFNNNYSEAWNFLLTVVKEYELHLMATMDNHNMLMRDTKDGMTRFRNG